MNRENLKKTVPQLVLACAVNLIVYYGAKAIMHGRPHLDLTTSLDEAIPLMSWTVVIYVAAFIFWIVNYYLTVSHGESGFHRLIAAHCMGEAVCFLCFIFLPTAMARPEITGTSVFDWMLSVVFAADVPSNLFPSIHCMISWFCWIGIRKDEKVPAWYRNASLIFAIAICISTVTVKQHFVADVPSGIFLAEVCYFLAQYFRRPAGPQKQ